MSNKTVPKKGTGSKAALDKGEFVLPAGSIPGMGMSRGRRINRGPKKGPKKGPSKTKTSTKKGSSKKRNKGKRKKKED